MPPFCYALPAVLFLALCIDRTRRGNNRIHKMPSNTNTSAETKEGAKKGVKQESNESKRRRQKRKETAGGDRRRQQADNGKAKPKESRKATKRQRAKKAQARELASVLAILIQAKQITALYILYPEKHINRQAREKRKLYYSPLCLYIK